MTGEQPNFDGEEPQIDPFDELVQRGLLDEADAEVLKQFRDSATSEQKAELARDLSDLGVELENAFPDTPLGKWFRTALENPELDRPPFLFAESSGVAPHGLTQEEWDALDESTRDTLRNRRYED